MLSRDEKIQLLQIARNAISRYLADGRYADEIPDSESLNIPCGAFVTLRKNGSLRGCIGQISARHPLYATVANMAVNAAVSDTRFDPVTLDELNNIDIEISILSPFTTISDIHEIDVGKHGLFIIHPASQGLLLPQVAEEYGWDRETFLDQTCLKAGLPPGTWKDKDTTIQIFTAELIDERDFRESVI